MIPTKSQTIQRGNWVEQQNKRSSPLIDYEMGGLVLNAAVDNLQAALWTAASDGSKITVQREGLSPTTVLTDTGITQIALAFDQTMRPHVAYMAGGVCKLYWFDTTTGAMATMMIPGATSPRICMDEKRAVYATQSDVLLSYKVGTNLCLRAQRERFATEHVIATGIPGELVAVGMNTNNRLQWKLVGNPEDWP
ncbi:tail fiber protein [Xanthomonas phage XAJ24]|uniref:Tail fiber protein n=1 Tax=Xanthomonas phage XAJ24 TaxID=1775250 RepID=A0A1I9L2B9_9CAUD|nr:tail fiber protein [Xanthomonas phage XAJ24]AMW36106.1 tail fiber protein [Xanthomonas phage XAJ24]